ncbi:MAG: tetratricopeptide repeat protein [Candidatus Dadabacteria bacterium]|nr:tetratricopeptide repeat protein [Candidatus Dadabacteria bacterium]
MNGLNFRTILLIILAIAAIVLILMLFFQRKRERGSYRSAYIDALYALIDGRKDDALRLLTMAVKSGETDVDAYIQLGNLLREKKMPEKALQIHRNLTVRRDLGYEEEKSIQIAIAEDLADMGRIERALGALDSIRRDKKDPEISMILHRLYHRCGDYDNAFATLKNIPLGDKEEHAAKLASYLAAVSSALIDSGDIENASRYLRKALKEDPDCIAALYLSGKLAMDREDFEISAQMWTTLLRKDITFFEEVLPKLEKALFESGRFERLEDLLEEFHEKNERYAMVPVSLAALYMKKGAVSKSISILEEERKSSKGNRAVSIKLASVYLAAGKEKEARQVLDEVELTARGRSGSTCGVCGAVSPYPLNYCPACSEFNTFKN